MEWLLFLPQLPSTPSSLRVNVWRKLHGAGAVGIQNGVWLLPGGPERSRFLQDLLATIQSQGASGQIFTVAPLTPEVENEILNRARSERDDEFAPVCERAADFLAELISARDNAGFNFEDLFRAEDDLNHLTSRLAKIMARDFAGSLRGEEAARLVAACQEAYNQLPHVSVPPLFKREIVRTGDGG